jgi:hypothetical protein
MLPITICELSFTGSGEVEILGLDPALPFRKTHDSLFGTMCLPEQGKGNSRILLGKRIAKDSGISEAEVITFVKLCGQACGFPEYSLQIPDGLCIRDLRGMEQDLRKGGYVMRKYDRS